MKLGTKRAVIEVLLCGTDWNGPVIEAAFSDKKLVKLAKNKARRIIKACVYSDIELDYCETAYRLIESSTTLRREWFG